MNKALIFGRSSERYADFGRIASLCVYSSIHEKWTAHDLMRLFLTPILLNQYRVFMAQDYPNLFGEEDRPVGFVTWGLFNDEAIQAYTQRTRKLAPTDYDSGDDVWVIDFCAPFGGTREMVRDMRRELSIRYPQKSARWIRNSQTPHRRLGYGYRRD